jgi:hypothetical protein
LGYVPIYICVIFSQTHRIILAISVILKLPELKIGRKFCKSGHPGHKRVNAQKLVATVSMHLNVFHHLPTFSDFKNNILEGPESSFYNTSSPPGVSFVT